MLNKDVIYYKYIFKEIKYFYYSFQPILLILI
jgi:hypothetical protein